MKKNLEISFLIIIGALIIAFFYGKAVTNSNNILFSNTGDAIKNYFTYAHHIKNDSTYLNFEGMNYPYGEHFLYTDCHPILANTLKLFSSKIPFFSTHAIGILNFLMILSIFLTFIVCYYLLLEFKLNKWISVFFSISITLLAPQLFRLGGHLALSYSLAIPLSWLLLIKCFKGKGHYTILLFVNNLFWMFIHSYLGIIVLFFLTTMLVTKAITDKARFRNIIKYSKIAGAVLFPILFFYLFLVLTDNHIDRTNNPSGFFIYNAEFDDIFVPHHGAIRTTLDKWTGGVIKLEWEAWSYVGLSTTALFIYLLILSLVSLFKKNKRVVLKWYFNNKELNIALFASFIVLLFAMAVPFKQIPSLLEYFPILKQFRATGRFTWPFYFCAMVFSAVVFNNVFIRLKSRNNLVFGILFIIIVNGLYIWEAFPYHVDVSKSITKSPNLFKYDLLPDKYKEAISQINSEDFQAILSLPFYYVGSESFSRPRNDEAVRASILFSYHTGIPNFCAALTRTSVSESKKIVQLVSPNFYEKRIKNDIKNDKPFLIVKINTLLTEHEQNILSQAKLIHSGDELEIYSLEYDKLFNSNAISIYNRFLERKPFLFKRDGFWVSDSSSFLYYNGFEDSISDIFFRGSGAYKSVKKGKNTFAEFGPNTFSDKKEYQIKFWMFNGEKDALNLWFRLIVEEYDETNNIWYSTTFFPEQSEVINGDWSLVEGVFKVNNPMSRIYIVSKGKENSKAELHADDLLIYEVGNDIYKFDKANGHLFYNNHKVKLR